MNLMNLIDFEIKKSTTYRLMKAFELRKYPEFVENIV
jgi:hypothetical protein